MDGPQAPQEAARSAADPVVAFYDGLVLLVLLLELGSDSGLKLSSAANWRCSASERESIGNPSPSSACFRHTQTHQLQEQLQRHTSAAGSAPDSLKVLRAHRKAAEGGPASREPDLDERRLEAARHALAPLQHLRSPPPTSTRRRPSTSEKGGRHYHLPYPLSYSFCSLQVSRCATHGLADVCAGAGRSLACMHAKLAVFIRGFRRWFCQHTHTHEATPSGRLQR